MNHNYRLPIAVLAITLMGFSFCLNPNAALAQHRQRCSTTELFKQYTQQHPSLMGLQARARTVALKHARRNNFYSKENAPDGITIPVAFHIVYNTEDEKVKIDHIHQQLKVLQDAYAGIDPNFESHTPEDFKTLKADTGIDFCLGQYYDAQGQLRDAIRYVKTDVAEFYEEDALTDEPVKYTDRGGSSPLNTAEYLNVWVCNLKDKRTSRIDAGAYATPPGWRQDRAGVVLSYQSFWGSGDPNFGLGKTLVHEVGHVFFLEHPWGYEICGDDFVEDTPPAEFADFDVPDISEPYNQGICSDDERGEMVCNYMNYYDDVALTMFTPGQAALMHSTLTVGGARETLLYSTACEKPFKMQSSCCPEIEHITHEAQNGTGITISWPRPQAALEGFEVRYRAVLDSEWSAPVKVTDNWYTFNNLLPQRSYYFQVRSVCADGQWGVWKSAGSRVSALQACHRPDDSQINLDITENTITVNWPEPVTTDFATVSLRELKANRDPEDGTVPDIDEDPLPIAKMVSVRFVAGTYTFNHLKPGTEYFVRLQWSCDDRFSEPFKTTVFTEGCRTPVTPLQYSPSSTGMVIETAELDVKAVKLLGAVREKNADTWQTEIESGTNTIAFSGLMPATAYEFRLRSVCGNGSYSEYIFGEQATLATGASAQGVANNEQTFTLYPNPAGPGQQIVIEQTEGPQQAYSRLLLINSRGEAIRGEQVSGTGPVHFTFSSLPTGLYLVVLHSRNSTITKRLIVSQ